GDEHCRGGPVVHGQLEDNHRPYQWPEHHKEGNRDPAMCNGVPEPACVHQRRAYISRVRRFSQDPSPRRGSLAGLPLPLLPAAPLAPARLTTGVDRLFSGTFGWPGCTAGGRARRKLCTERTAALRSALFKTTPSSVAPARCNDAVASASWRRLVLRISTTTSALSV